jgi:Zn-dependent protease/predicted transcriptional regulator
MHFRLLGFPISLHYSWLVAFCLLTWALSTAMFKDALPGVPMRAHWAAGAVATLFILASVLFHEIAHAVVARRYQYQIKRIYLHILGGWTVFDRELQTPNIEARVAAAGPAFSFGLAGILWCFSADPIVRELYKVNMMLGAYNLLIPCVPLDGGRILHAFLWARGGSYAVAAEQTARLSKQISNGMMALGGLGIILQFNTFWLIIVGIVLRIIAAGTYKTVQQSSKLTRPVQEIMVPTNHVRTLPITASIQDLQTTFLRHGYKVYPVMDGDTVIGLVHYHNVREDPTWLEASQGAIRPHVVPLRQELMVSSQTTLQEALDQMLLAGSDEVLVYSHDTFMGLVKRSMILRVQQSISEPGPMKKEDKPIGLPLWENR